MLFCLAQLIHHDWSVSDECKLSLSMVGVAKVHNVSRNLKDIEGNGMHIVIATIKSDYV